MDEPLTRVDFDLTAFPCPRCQAVVGGEFYGPCKACCDELSAKMRREGDDVVAEEYVPKMNVTPNAVASKE